MATTQIYNYQILDGTISASKLVGTDINTVGTITTGSWTASVIADAYLASALTGKTYNGLTLTSQAVGFTIAGGSTSKTLTVNNTLGLSGTDGSTLNIGTGGTLGTAAFTASTAYIANQTSLQSSSNFNISGNGYIAGNFGLGLTTPLYKFHLHSDTANTARVVASEYNSTTVGPLWFFIKGRGSYASPTIVQNGDEIGGFVFCGQDSLGTFDSLTGAKIISYADAAWSGTSSSAGRIELQTTVAGSNTPTARLVVKNNGNILIGTTTDASTGILQVTGNTSLTGTLAVSSTINSQTISSAANFTGTMVVTSSITAASVKTSGGYFLTGSSTGLSFYDPNDGSTVTSKIQFVDGSGWRSDIEFYTNTAQGDPTLVRRIWIPGGGAIPTNTYTNLGGTHIDQLTVDSTLAVSSTINGQTISSAASFTGTATFADRINTNSSGSNPAIGQTVSAGTSGRFLYWFGTGGSLYFGCNNSAGTLAGVIGASAYSMFFGADSNVDLHLITNNNVRFTISGAGNATLTGTLTASISALGTTATTFLTHTAGLIQSRTATQVLADIGAAGLRNYNVFTATAAQTTFTIPSGYVPGLIDVFVNGTKLIPTTDYTATSGTSIVLTSAAALNDIVETYDYRLTASNWATSRATQTFTATASQTTFTISGGYTVGMVDVYYNGARLMPSDYTATNGTTVVLGTGAPVGTIVDIVVYGNVGSGYLTTNLTLGQNGVTDGFLNSPEGLYLNSDSDATSIKPIVFGTQRATNSGGTEWARLDTSGRLLVGSATSPSSSNVQALLAGSGSAYIQFSRTTTTIGGGSIGTDGTDLFFYTHTGAIGSESSTERMRIQANGGLKKVVSSSLGSTYEFRAAKTFNENTSLVNFFKVSISDNTSVQFFISVGSRNAGVGGYTSQLFHAVLYYTYLGWTCQYNNMSNSSGGCASYIADAYSSAAGEVTFRVTTPNNGTSTTAECYAAIQISTQSSSTVTFTQL